MVGCSSLGGPFESMICILRGDIELSECPFRSDGGRQPALRGVTSIGAPGAEFS